MIPEALEEKIIAAKNAGYQPFFVNATAGTTVYGAFDPINQIADICDRHNLWLHVDVRKSFIYDSSTLIQNFILLFYCL